MKKLEDKNCSHLNKYYEKGILKLHIVKTCYRQSNAFLNELKKKRNMKL